MGRIKHSRKINFKPLYKKFAPTDKGTTGTTHLLDEEMEATISYGYTRALSRRSCKKDGDFQTNFYKDFKKC